jgi:23S rRNA (cytidine1920-2'-O)/16S rRNA (cytidine1409-2'-O)-methyltransferase
MRRLDQELVDRGLCESREKAKRSILAGQVRVNDQVARKPGDRVRPGDSVALTASERFVSRGGYKLEHALEHFEVDLTGWTAIDIGASTGGFTDCLLQRGAARVYAIDVGRGQLAWKLRQDSRVVVMEKTNARTLTADSFPEPFRQVDLAVADCSFISLRKIIPAAVALLKPSGKIVALIKPQFEAGKNEADRGAGVIRDAAVHERVLNELKTFVEHFPGALRWLGVTESPLLGPAGNKEFLALIEKIG